MAKTVLVVDDEKKYAEAHARMLEDEYEVQTAYSGESALAEIDDQVDVVLLDRNMPRKSGDSVAAEIRDRDIECRIVMLTAVDPDLDIVDLKIDDYLTKPVTEAQLKACLDSVIEWGTYDQQLQDYFSLSNKREALLTERPDIENTEQFAEIEQQLMQAAKQGLQKSEETLRTLIRSSPAAIVALDVNGHVEIWNQSATELFGWSYEEVVGEDPPMFPRAAEGTINEIRQKLFAKSTITDVHIECVTASGSHVDVSLSAGPLHEGGEMSGTMFVMTDITERKQREQRLSVLSRVLRHNMRNDLNVVLGRLDVIEQHLPESERHHVETIADTIDDLLSMGRKAQSAQQLIDEETNRPERRNVPDLFDSVAKTIRQRYPDVPLEKTVASGAESIIAQKGLHFALLQLLENGIEHNDSTHPRVRLGASPREDGAITLSVVDNGPGIPQSEIQILDADAEGALEHGSGLGLWTVRWIADRAGWELLFDTGELGGSRVSIVVPDGIP